MHNDVRLFRKERKITQAELAKRAGICRAALSMIENESTVPSVETAAKLAQVLETTIDSLFFL